jgi:outer membrane protein assembly factor BamD (BamD/ComL family)
MNRRSVFLCLVIAGTVLLPLRSPAPLVFYPGEGWVYERYGSEGKWRKTRAEDQLKVAQTAFEQGDYGLALRAARYTVRTWPLSDFAPAAQYLVGRSYEERQNDEKAFAEYQKILEQYPKSDNVREVLARQYLIADRFLHGQWFKLWGYIPIFPSMDRTAEMFDQVVKNGPFSEVGPHAQLRIGAAREKKREYPQAVKAYEAAADRYHDRPQIAADALFRAGMSYQKQAKTAEYDQSMAGQAIASLNDFATLFPGDARVPGASQTVADLKIEQARGNYRIAQFYEKREKWLGERMYYNEVANQVPDSPAGAVARERVAAINKIIESTPAR